MAFSETMALGDLTKIRDRKGKDGEEEAEEDSYTATLAPATEAKSVVVSPISPKRHALTEGEGEDAVVAAGSPLPAKRSAHPATKRSMETRKKAPWWENGGADTVMANLDTMVSHVACEKTKMKELQQELWKDMVSWKQTKDHGRHVEKQRRVSLEQLESEATGRKRRRRRGEHKRPVFSINKSTLGGTARRHARGDSVSFTQMPELRQRPEKKTYRMSFLLSQDDSSQLHGTGGTMFPSLKRASHAVTDFHMPPQDVADAFQRTRFILATATTLPVLKQSREEMPPRRRLKRSCKGSDVGRRASDVLIGRASSIEPAWLDAHAQGRGQIPPVPQGRVVPLGGSQKRPLQCV